MRLTPPSRKTPLRAAQRQRRTAREAEPSRAVRMLVMARDGWCCRRCGKSVIGLPYSVSPRKLRSHEGESSPSGLILLCGTETLLCRGYVHSHIAESYQAGWLVRSTQDPALVPVIIAGGISVWLDDSGTYSVEEPPAGAA
jgi:hypothetical protein